MMGPKEAIEILPKFHLVCRRCGKLVGTDSKQTIKNMSYIHYSYCEDCLREGLKLLKEKDGHMSCSTCKHKPPEKKWPCVDCDMREPADRWEAEEPKQPDSGFTSCKNEEKMHDRTKEDLISRKWLMEVINEGWMKFDTEEDINRIIHLIRDIAPSVEQPEIIRCKDCKHWRQQTNYQGVLLSFGFCESEEMWGSLYGETYEVEHIDTNDDHYCGYAERRTDG